MSKPSLFLRKTNIEPACAISEAECSLKKRKYGQLQISSFHQLDGHNISAVPLHNRSLALPLLSSVSNTAFVGLGSTDHIKHATQRDRKFDKISSRNVNLGNDANFVTRCDSLSHLISDSTALSDFHKSHGAIKLNTEPLRQKNDALNERQAIQNPPNHVQFGTSRSHISSSSCTMPVYSNLANPEQTDISISIPIKPNVSHWENEKIIAFSSPNHDYQQNTSSLLKHQASGIASILNDCQNLVYTSNDCSQLENRIEKLPVDFTSTDESGKNVGLIEEMNKLKLMLDQKSYALLEAERKLNEADELNFELHATVAMSELEFKMGADREIKRLTSELSFKEHAIAELERQNKKMAEEFNDILTEHQNVSIGTTTMSSDMNDTLKSSCPADAESKALLAVQYPKGKETNYLLKILHDQNSMELMQLFSAISAVPPNDIFASTSELHSPIVSRHPNHNKVTPIQHINASFDSPISRMSLSPTPKSYLGARSSVLDMLRMRLFQLIGNQFDVNVEAGCLLEILLFYMEELFQLEEMGRNLNLVVPVTRLMDVILTHSSSLRTALQHNGFSSRISNIQIFRGTILKETSLEDYLDDSLHLSIIGGDNIIIEAGRRNKYHILGNRLCEIILKYFTASVQTQNEANIFALSGLIITLTSELESDQLFKQWRIFLCQDLFSILITDNWQCNVKERILHILRNLLRNKVIFFETIGRTSDLDNLRCESIETVSGENHFLLKSICSELFIVYGPLEVSDCNLYLHIVRLLSQVCVMYERIALDHLLFENNEGSKQGQVHIVVKLIDLINYEVDAWENKSKMKNSSLFLEKFSSTKKMLIKESLQLLYIFFSYYGRPMKELLLKNGLKMTCVALFDALCGNSCFSSLGVGTTAKRMLDIVCTS